MQKQILLPFDKCKVRSDLGLFLEKRMEYDGSNVTYVGYNREPNAATDELSWFIILNEYDGDNLVRYRLPDDGVQFKYSWDDRATYFS